MNLNMSSHFQYFIEDLIYIPTARHNPMYIRPYSVNMDPIALDKIVNKLAENKTSKVTSNIVGEVSSRIIQPSAIGYNTAIDSSWLNERRYIFLLKVKNVDPMGQETISYIQGFTECDGITKSGHIDPNLAHTVNNVIDTIVTTINTPFGIERKERLLRIYDVLSSGIYDMLYTKRPLDMLNYFTVMSSTYRMDMGDQLNDSIRKYYDTSSILNKFNNKPLGSSVVNNVPSAYIGRILNTGIQITNENELMNSYVINQDFDVESKVPEPEFSDNQFIRHIQRLSGFNVTKNTFVFQNLMNYDPTIYNRFKVLNITKDYVDPTLSQTPEIGEYWHGQDPVTVKAYTLIESSVALALSTGFNKIFFTASNMTNPLGTAEIFITNFNSFINLDETEFNYLLELFKNRFISDVFLPETNGGTIPMHIEGYIDILGTTKILLSFAGYPQTWYTAPTFANSLFNPMLEPNDSTYRVNGDNIIRLIDTVVGNMKVTKIQPAYY